MQEKLMREVSKNGLLFTTTVTGIFFFFVWAVTDVLPIELFRLSGAFLAVTLQQLLFYFGEFVSIHFTLCWCWAYP